MTYCDLMQKSTELRDAAVALLSANTPRDAAVRRLVNQLDGLVETAYETGDDEGFVRGHGEGETLGRAESRCHRLKDEEVEYNLTH